MNFFASLLFISEWLRVGLFATVYVDAIVVQIQNSYFHPLQIFKMALRLHRLDFERIQIHSTSFTYQNDSKRLYEPLRASNRSS